MSIKLWGGSLNVKDIQVGNKIIKEVYNGDDLVYDKLHQIILVKNGVFNKDAVPCLICDQNDFSPNKSIGTVSQNSFSIPSSTFNYISNYNSNGPYISLSILLNNPIKFNKQCSYKLYYDFSVFIKDYPYNSNSKYYDFYGINGLIYSGNGNADYTYNINGNLNMNFVKDQIFNGIGLITIYRNWIARQGYRVSESSGSINNLYLIQQ